MVHTYFLTSSISSLEGSGKVINAVILSFFLSTTLLFFTSISDKKPDYWSKKVRDAVTLFMIIEITINLYYYSRHLIVESISNNLNQDLNWYEKIGMVNLFDFGFAVIISVLIPYTLKLYSTHIRAKEWVEEIEAEKIEKEKTEKLDNLNPLSNPINTESLKKEIIMDIDEEIKNSFQKNSDLFLNQFKNKIKTIQDNSNN